MEIEQFNKDEIGFINKKFDEIVRQANLMYGLYGEKFDFEEIIDAVLDGRKHRIIHIDYRVYF